jgi:hypothetical protein
MRKFFILLGSAVAMTTFAQAENWTGKLLDASCYDREHSSARPASSQTSAAQGQSQSTPQTQPTTQAQQGQQGQPTTGQASSTTGQDASCVATAQTTAFAFEAAGGKVYKLDDNGNTRAMAALRNRADRSTTGGQSTGTTQGQTGTQRDIMAKVDGTESGGTIKVTTIELQ